MKAEEIRGLHVTIDFQGQPYSERVAMFQAKMLQEIAAQLATLNEFLSAGNTGINVILCASNDDIPVRVSP